MSSFNKKSIMSVAAPSNSHFNLSHKHIGTLDFNRLKPIYCQYMVPGDSFNVQVSNLTRLLPMPVPTYSEIKHTLRAFFVPCQFLMPSFNDFIIGRPSNTTESSKTNFEVLHTTVGTLREVFQHPSFSDDLSGASSVSLDTAVSNIKSGACDFFYKNSDDTFHCKKFTTGGRWSYDTIVSLGLNFPLSWTQDNTAYDTKKINILPLIALVKFYQDWIVPSRFIDQLSFNVNGFIRKNSSGYVGITNLLHLCSFLPTYLQNDYFTASWQNASGPESHLNTVYYSIPQNSVENPSQGTLDNAVSFDGNISSSSVGKGAYKASNNSSFNEYTLLALGALQNMLNRGKLAGSKIQDWLKTEFGMTPSSDALQLSTYLGKFTDTIQISDVMSNSDTYDYDNDTGAFLGQFAGKGIGASSSNWEYSTKVHGYLIITSELTAPTSYWQGLRPEFSMIDKFDFFQPEFDNLGVEALSTQELCFTNDVVGNVIKAPTTLKTDSYASKVFGFTPMYSKLKYRQDTLSGDFRIRHLNTGLSSWYIARQFAGNGHYINRNFCTDTYNNANVYDNIFSYSTADIDHFYMLYYLKVDAYRPMHQVSSFLDPDEFGHKKVTVDTNGNIE